MLKKILKKIMITILIVIGLSVILFFAFTIFYPSFGGNSTKKQQLVYAQSHQFNNGKFRNTNSVPKELSFTKTLSLAYKFFTTKLPNGRPKEDLNAQKIDSINIADYSGQARMIWCGDSGYAPHFKEIEQKYDPFDLALMKCGQYNLM
tara:strand:- start:399 stop:842 length:444 start_codon:yes stop_codon:yes gene_type:complete